MPREESERCATNFERDQHWQYKCRAITNDICALIEEFKGLIIDDESDKEDAINDMIVAPTSEPVVNNLIDKPISEPVINNSINTLINKSERPSIIDDKPMARYDDPFDPEVEPKPMIKFLQCTVDRATTPPLAQDAQIERSDGINLHHQTIDIGWWRRTVKDERCDLMDRSA